MDSPCSESFFEERVLVLAPVGKDARLITDALEKSGLRTLGCRTMNDVSQAEKEGVASIFLTEEAFEDPTQVEILFQLVEHQPSWSDLPLIVSFGKAHRLSKTFQHTLAILDNKCNLILLERPMNPRLLINAVRSAVKNRKRQYERRRFEAERENLLDELAVAKDQAEAALVREKESRQYAEDANRSKDVFLATLSHELRTPLNAILGFSEILPYEEPGSPEFDSALATIVRNAKAQSDLIDDILDVSRIISGKLAIEKAPINVVKLISETLESFQLAARQKDIRLVVTGNALSAILPGDAKRLQQIFWNLLSNAIKFTPRGGEIQVEIYRNADELVTVIRDKGEGIESEFIPFIFDRFRQQDGSFTRRFGGLGLGLSIVQYLVDAHQGTIRAESPGKGQGATFTVSLPLFLRDSSNPVSPEISILPKLRPTKGRVLIVDDQMDNRSLVSIVLRREGYEVVESDSASSARRALSESDFDAIVCDIGMPEEDGLTFIHRLRASVSSPQVHLPAAALSGFVSEEDKRRALRAGFDMHLSKPIHAGEVISAVNKLLTLGRSVAPIH